RMDQGGRGHLQGAQARLQLSRNHYDTGCHKKDEQQGFHPENTVFQINLRSNKYDQDCQQHQDCRGVEPSRTFVEYLHRGESSTVLRLAPTDFLLLFLPLPVMATE